MNRIDFNTAVEVRVAFQYRRRELINNWREAVLQGSTWSADLWASSLQRVNDAQLALGLGRE